METYSQSAISWLLGTYWIRLVQCLSFQQHGCWGCTEAGQCYVPVCHSGAAGNILEQVSVMSQFAIAWLLGTYWNMLVQRPSFQQQGCWRHTGAAQWNVPVCNSRAFGDILDHVKVMATFAIAWLLGTYWSRLGKSPNFQQQGCWRHTEAGQCNAPFCNSMDDGDILEQVSAMSMFEIAWMMGTYWSRLV